MSIEQQVKQAGIVGAGGAGFPSHVKCASQASTVIANGAECEPLLRCDKAVMQERTEQVLRGLRLLAQATGAKRTVLALKGHYRDVVAKVEAVVATQFPEIEVYKLGNYYPAGDEQVLVYEVTGKIVPEGGIPLQVDTVVNNVITLSQIAQAVDSGGAVTSRPLTVAGEVSDPLTCDLPIGAPMGLAVELAGGATTQPWAIVEGGPMMGKVVHDPLTPITKKTSGVVVLRADHPLVTRIQATTEREASLAHAVCCQCRMCTDLCPRFNLGHEIEPHLAMRAQVTAGMSTPESSHISAAYLCCMCGVCEVYACPLGLSPRKVYEKMLQELRQQGKSNPHQRTDVTANDFVVQRRIPLPRLIARLGLSRYQATPARVSWQAVDVPRVELLLSQHIGAPAQPIVATGQKVTKGEVIGEIPEGKLGARVHASIDGQVTSISDHSIVIERSQGGR